MTDFQLHTELRRCRLAARLIQESVAHSIGCAPSTMTKFERGDRVPSVRQTEDMLRLYRVPRSERPQFLDAARVQLAPVTHGEFRQMQAQLADMRDSIEALTAAILSNEVNKVSVL